MINIEEVIKCTKELKILYVEDNQETRESTLMILKEFFNDIIIAVDGEDGYEKFKQNNIDLIITDINMPKMNGLEMSKNILNIDSNIPILIFSAHNESHYFIDAIKIGVEGYLLKPIVIDQFLLILGKITKTINIKKENLEYKTSLENKVKSQVKEIINKQNELNSFKEHIITIFSHELKTPLNAILGYSGYINRSIQKKLTPSKIDKIETLSKKIYTNGVIQLDMVNNLLESAKLHAGKLIVDKIDTNLNEIIKNIIEFYRETYDTKKLILDIDTSINAFIDKNIFNIIFTNLYTNSLKYSKLNISISLIKDSKNSFILIVEDDGLGIPKDKREKVFHMFEQLDSDTLTRETEGTGVGLYTVKNFTNLCNMSIEIEESIDLGGAKFILKLPIEKN